MDGLTLRFERDDHDGDRLLFATLRVGEFRGGSQYRCAPDEFSDLMEGLATYPIDPSSPIRGEWIGSIRLEIEPFGITGQLTVTAALVDFTAPRNRCEASFRCHYADLGRFRDALTDAIAKGVGEAKLTAS